MTETISNANAAASTLFLGHNGEWWDFVVIVSVIAVALAATAGGVATIGSIVSHKRETAAAEEALDRYKVDTGKQIAEANARQKEAELKLAKLRKLASPRSIDVETFVKTLEGKPKAHVQIWYLPDVSDVWMLSFQLKIALLHAGWQVDEPIEIPEPDSKNPLVKGMPRAMVAGGQPSGVTIVRDGTTDMIRDGTPAKALWDAFGGHAGRVFYYERIEREPIYAGSARYAADHNRGKK